MSRARPTITADPRAWEAQTYSYSNEDAGRWLRAWLLGATGKFPSGDLGASTPEGLGYKAGRSALTEAQERLELQQRRSKAQQRRAAK